MLFDPKALSQKEASSAVDVTRDTFPMKSNLCGVLIKNADSYSLVWTAKKQLWNFLRSFLSSGAVFTTLHFLCSLEWAQKAGVLHYIKPERLARDKHSTFLGPLVKVYLHVSPILH
jgi:hypothetical protein